LVKETPPEREGQRVRPQSQDCILTLLAFRFPTVAINLDWCVAKGVVSQ
jgi:hypothetical protein